jgi:hypothetical protein
MFAVHELPRLHERSLALPIPSARGRRVFFDFTASAAMARTARVMRVSVRARGGGGESLCCGPVVRRPAVTREIAGSTPAGTAAPKELARLGGQLASFAGPNTRASDATAARVPAGNRPSALSEAHAYGPLGKGEGPPRTVRPARRHLGLDMRLGTPSSARFDSSPVDRWPVVGRSAS